MNKKKQQKSEKMNENSQYKHTCVNTIQWWRFLVVFFFIASMLPFLSFAVFEIIFSCFFDRFTINWYWIFKKLCLLAVGIILSSKGTSHALFQSVAEHWQVARFLLSFVVSFMISQFCVFFIYLFIFFFECKIITPKCLTNKKPV